MHKKGFTLTELIASIVVIAIILGLAVAAYVGIRANILKREYENLVTYLETKAASYAEDTGELNVTVERLIETGYVEADEAKIIKNPIDNSSMNCFIFDSKFENGNYQAKMEPDSIGEDTNGKCNSYEISKEIQICVKTGSNCVTTFQEWYNDNVELSVLIGGLPRDNSVIVWKVNGKPYEQAVYKTDISSINKGIYTAEVRYDDATGGVVKHFEGTDTVAINIDRELPAVTKVKVESPELWLNRNREVDITFTDYSGSGVKLINVYNVTENNRECPNLLDEGWKEVTSNNYKVALGVGKYRVCVMDYAGNVSKPYPGDSDDPNSWYIDITNIDSGHPECTINIVGGEIGENDWYKEYPTIVLEYQDGTGSGVASYYVGTSSEEHYGATSEIVIKSDNAGQLYYGFVKDYAGNKGSCELDKPLKVDKTAPTLTNITKSTNAWTNEKIEIKTTAEDQTSLLASYAVMDENVEPTNWVTIPGNKSKEEIKYQVSKNGVYYIWVKDYAGNKTNKSITISNFDDTKPTVSTPTINPIAWTNGDVTITASASDNESKLKGYTVTTSNSVPTSWTAINNAPASYTINHKITGNGTYYVWVKDTAGNTNYSTIIITNIDKTKPTVNTPTISPTSWTNGNVTVSTAVVDNESKLIGYAVTTTNSTPTSWTPISGSPTNFTVPYTATTNGTYYIWVKDTAGNTNYSTIKITNIDKTKPTVNTPTISPTSWTNGNVTITTVLKDSDSKLKEYAVTESNTTPTSGWTSIGSGPETFTATYTATKNGTYYVWVRDIAGNVNSNSIKVTNIDKTKPTVGTPTLSKTTWTNANITITTALTDNDSKLKEFAVTQTSTAPTSGWTKISNSPATYSATYTATENATYYIWAKDNAGNVNSNSIKVTNIDKVAPTCTNSGDSTSWTNGNRTINYGCSDTASGCNTSYMGGSKAFSTTTKTATIAAYTIKDNAGNSTSCAARTANVYVDKTLPTCTNSGDSTSWTNGNRTINYGCSDDDSGCHTSYKGGSKAFSTTTKTATIAAYTIKDNAGNTVTCAARTANVYVDKTAPTCTSSGDSTTWTNANRTINYSCSDADSGCHASYKGGSKAFSTTTKTATIAAYTIKDNAGNSTNCVARTANVYVDKAAPTCTNSGDSTSWTNGNRTINYSCSDADSGCHASYKGGSKAFSTTTKTATIAAYTIKDNAGNSTNCAARTANVYVDKTAPTCTNSGDSTTWTNADRTINYGCSDADSGCHASYKGGSKTFNTTTKTATIAAYTIKDNAGNSTSCAARTANVYVDKAAPTLDGKATGY